MAFRFPGLRICDSRLLFTAVERPSWIGTLAFASRHKRFECSANAAQPVRSTLIFRRCASSSSANGGQLSEDSTAGLRKSYFKWYRDKSAEHAGSMVGGVGASGTANANVVVLMQVGSVFEIYDEVNLDTGECITNAATVADAVGLACSRKVEGRIQVETYSFPETELSKFEGMLVRHGYTVVVIGQRMTGETVVGHHWLRTSTFSTFETVAGTGFNRYIWGLDIYFDGSGDVSGAAAAVNCSTGDFAFCDVAGKQFRLDDIDALMQGYPVSELVVWSSGQKVDVRNVLNLPSSVQVFERKPLPGGAGIANREMDALVRAFKREATTIVDTMDLARHPDRRSVIAHLIDHIGNFDPKLTESLQLPTVMCASSHMRLGKRTLPQLNVTGDRGYAQLFVRGTRTKLGQRAIMKRICDPIYDAKLLTERFDRVRDTMGWISRMRQEAADAVDQVRRRLGQIRDLRRLKRRLETGSFSAADLHLLVGSIDAWRHIRSLTGTSLADESAAERDFVKHVATTWDLQRCSDHVCRAAFAGASQPAAAAHPWARGVHPDLDELEDEWLACKTEYMAVMQSAVAGMRGPKLSISDFDSCVKGQYFLPTSTNSRCNRLYQALWDDGGCDTLVDNIGPGDLSLVETAQLCDINERGAGIANALNQRIEKYWLQDVGSIEGSPGLVPADDAAAAESAAAAPSIASLALRSGGKGWSDLEASIAAVDVELAIAQVALEQDFCLPTIDEPAATSAASSGSGLDIKGLRHPLIEGGRPEVPYTPNDVRLGAGVDAQHDGMLLFGANGTGKSTLLKAIGLAVLSAQAGLPVAAASMRLVPYTSMFPRIISNDDQFAGLSSFDAEVAELKHMVEHAGSRTLVLGDELCSGTEISSATSILGAGIDAFSNKGTQFVLATHFYNLWKLPGLKQLQRLDWRHLSASFKFDAGGGRIEYGRRLQPGPGSQAYGIEVCKARGMDVMFLEKASEFRNFLTGKPEDGALTGAKVSRYARSVSKVQCDVCGVQAGDASLEVHHIKPQRDADKRGIVAPGTHKNDQHNLCTLCEACHLAHHRGDLNIIGWQDTSSGVELVFEHPMAKGREI